MARSENRLSQYKNCGRGGGERFKEQLRKSVLQRLQTRRQSLFNSRRNITDDVDNVLREVIADSPLPENVGIDLIEQLRAELLQDELEDWAAWEKEQTDEAFEAHLGPPEVFCPSCIKDVLSFSLNTVTCPRCPFRHTFPFTGVPSQSQLHDWLFQSCSKHSEGCSGQLIPIENTSIHSSPLALHCSSCGYTCEMVCQPPNTHAGSGSNHDNGMEM